MAKLYEYIVDVAIKTEDQFHVVAKNREEAIKEAKKGMDEQWPDTTYEVTNVKEGEPFGEED